MSTCQCGCGRPTPIATRNRTSRGQVKGQHERYLSGHTAPRVCHPKYYRETYRPDAEGGGRLTHLLIAERALGRSLAWPEQVHHVDGNKHNNSPANLVVCQDTAYHQLLHVRARVLNAGGDPNTEKMCSGCGCHKPFAEFYRNTENVAHGRGNYCRACVRIVQSGGRPKKVVGSAK